MLTIRSLRARRPVAPAVAALSALLALAAPAVARAQPYQPQTPLAFTGPTQAYTVFGCGEGPLTSAPNGPQGPLFCLDGTATVGVATTAGGANIFQAVLDLTGTRVGSFAGRFFDIDYSNIQLGTRYRHTDGSAFTDPTGFAPPTDATGHWTSAYQLFAGTPLDLFQVPSDGVTFGPAGVAQLGYVPAGQPYQPGTYGRNLFAPLVVTATPEPASLTLVLGGLAVLGVGGWRRRTARA